MDDNKLRTFITVANEGSFTRAADRLYLSAVAVKSQIDALEAELGEKLFLRKATGCTLSAAGNVFISHARKILKDIDTARSEVEKAAIAASGEVVIGHSIAFNYRYIGTLSTGFSAVRENHLIQFEKIPHDELISHLLRREVHCILAESGLVEEKYRDSVRFDPIISLPFYAIMKKGHPLSNRDKLRPDELEGQEIYASSMMSSETLSMLRSLTDHLLLIEETDRNVLFNRIIKNAVEIYPNRFDYYTCIPLDIAALNIGLYTLKHQPDIIREVIDYTSSLTAEFSSSQSIL